MPGWRWVHVPGHTVGQVALFRESDRCLIAADAFVTTKQESLYTVATQKQEVHGPPAYFTPDWPAARRSVERLAGLRPSIAATGHGTPMRGEDLTRGLDKLVQDFDEIAVPDHGRYVPDETNVLIAMTATQRVCASIPYRRGDVLTWCSPRPSS